MSTYSRGLLHTRRATRRASARVVDRRRTGNSRKIGTTTAREVIARASWDARRFAKTFFDFNPPPNIGPLRPMLRAAGLFEDDSAHNTTATTTTTSASSAQEDGNVVLLGAGALDRVKWASLDDVVMGGVSESKLDVNLENGNARFRGFVSEANNGGFASVRSRNAEPPIDLSQSSGIEIVIGAKAGGGDASELPLRFKLLVRSDTYWDGYAWSKSFDAKPGGTVRLAWNDFICVRRAMTITDAATLEKNKLDIARIASFQLMLSKFEYDSKLNPNFSSGPFEIDVQAIRSWKQQ